MVKDAGSKYNAVLRSYRFQRGKTPGVIEVVNENSYVMAEYRQRTGTITWQRLVLSAQRELIENWLHEQYPQRNSA